MQNDYNELYMKNNSRINNVVKNSTNCKPVKNSRKKKQKQKEIIDLAAKVIILLALGYGIGHGAQNIVNTGLKEESIKNSISVVGENTNYFGYNENEGSPYWSYDVRNIAENILNENKEYDIDTRIYGCYSNLNEYKKENYMNHIFVLMNQIIEKNPEKYTEEEIKACSHNTFKEYLNSKNISEEEYTKLMKKIIKAYAKEEIHEAEIEELLFELNGGTR